MAARRHPDLSRWNPMCSLKSTENNSTRSCCTSATACLWFPCIITLCSVCRPVLSAGGSDGGCWVLGTGRFGEKCFGPATNCKSRTPSCGFLLVRSRFGLFFSITEQLFDPLSPENSSSCLSQPMMDRNCAEQLPKMQCGFIDFVCSFVYKVKTFFFFYTVPPCQKMTSGGW